MNKKSLRGIVTGIFLKIRGPKVITSLDMGKTERSKVLVTTWSNMVQNTVLKVMIEIAHYKESFWGANVCGLGILSQPAGIPSMLSVELYLVFNCNLFKYICYESTCTI